MVNGLSFFDLALGDILSPVVLFFMFGVGAALARSDLSVPEAVAKTLALFLMMSIGLRGGVEVAETGLTAAMLLAGLCGLLLSVLPPLPAFWALRSIGLSLLTL